MSVNYLEAVVATALQGVSELFPISGAGRTALSERWEHLAVE